MICANLGAINMRRTKRGKSSSLVMPKAPQVNISKYTQASKLGDAPVGIPSFFFNNYWLVSVEPKFLLLHMSCAILARSFYFTCCLNKIIGSEILNRKGTLLSVSKPADLG